MLRYYTVESVCIQTNRIHKANIMATSEKDALKIERGSFGEPFFRVLRAYVKE